MRAIRLIWRTLGGLWSVLMMLLMAASLALNVAMAVSPVVFAAVAGAVEAVSGVRSLATRNAARTTALEARATRAEARAASEAAEAAKARAARQVTYRGARRPAAEAVADTSDRLARRTARGAARNIGSVAGEAIPVIGVGVIAAATAWELHDACAMMSEVRELDVALNPERAVPPEATQVCGMKAPTRAEIWAAVASSPGAAWDEARGLYEGLPALDLGGTWGASLGMFRAIYDWAFGSPAGPVAPDGTAPLPGPGSDWNPLNWWDGQ
ncbi:hypothetical protein DRW48_02770 [Paracoccus suum]|uniref:Uncharacterized protein n=1 Tax=Paracoccus suum TaxID=2259340 RepID=A0A344PHA1_9RHOB|nr:hypothetical protein [Paracoccus suum]AXC48756.1 hypothetical protein DRW48_02770 [Paracoccus suum]